MVSPEILFKVKNKYKSSQKRNEFSLHANIGWSIKIFLKKPISLKMHSALNCLFQEKYQWNILKLLQEYNYCLFKTSKLFLTSTILITAVITMLFGNDVFGVGISGMIPFTVLLGMNQVGA